MAASLTLVACGSVVVVEDAPITTSSGGGGSGGAPSGAGGDLGETTSTATGDPKPSPYENCTTVCSEPSDASHCSCKMFCTDPTFTTPNARIACAPLAEGSSKIQCVCTYGVDFSGVCFEKKNESCDFELGCCAKYFSGK